MSDHDYDPFVRGVMLKAESFSEEELVQFHKELQEKIAKALRRRSRIKRLRFMVRASLLLVVATIALIAALNPGNIVRYGAAICATSGLLILWLSWLVSQVAALMAIKPDQSGSSPSSSQRPPPGGKKTSSSPRPKSRSEPYSKPVVRPSLGSQSGVSPNGHSNKKS